MPKILLGWIWFGAFNAEEMISRAKKGSEP